MLSLLSYIAQIYLPQSGAARSGLGSFTQSLIKTISYRQAHRQSDVSGFSVDIPSS